MKLFGTTTTYIVVMCGESETDVVEMKFGDLASAFSCIRDHLDDSAVRFDPYLCGPDYSRD